MLVMRCGTYPAHAAHAGIRLPPTLEADKPVRKVGKTILSNKLSGLILWHSMQFFARWHEFIIPFFASNEHKNWLEHCPRAQKSGFYNVSTVGMYVGTYIYTAVVV